MATTCQDNIGPNAVQCSQLHCGSYAETTLMKSICHCQDWKGNPIPGCTTKPADFPISTTECWNRATGVTENITPSACFEKAKADPNWTVRDCFCCCSCFAWGTRIALPGEVERAVQEIGVGETVLSGSVRMEDGRLVLQWSPRAVVFSDGTSPAPDQEVVVVQYGDQGELVVTPDQPFLMPDGTLKRADRLVAEDQLVDARGEAVAIAAVHAGRLPVGMHNLATEASAQGGLDHHLLTTNGIVAGDHVARMLQDSPPFAGFFAEGHDELPVIGTEEYAARTGQLFRSAGDGEERAVRARGFVPMQAVDETAAPRGAATFVTPRQARALAKGARFAPPTSAVNQAEFRYLRQLFRGFFPDIHFSLDADSTVPNAYAFESYGIRVVEVSGKLLRARALGREGLAFVMAQGVARFIGGPPDDGDGVTCTGQADYFALGYVFTTAFYGQSTQWGLAALAQVRTLFDAIPEADATGTDRCMDPGIDCRLAAMDAALAGMELPRCAGAPEPGTLRLESAAVREVDEARAVVAAFSAPLDPRSVANVTNYAIRPVSSVTLAEIDPMDPRQVVLNVVFPRDAAGTFSLAVADLLAEDGSTLDRAASRVEFEVPPR